MRKSLLWAGSAMLLTLAACDQQIAPGETPAAPAPAAPEVPASAPAPVLTKEQLATNFETWTLIGNAVVKDAAAAAPDGSMTADVLDLKNGEGVGFLDSNVGPEVSAAVMLWGQVGQNVTLQLVNWCRSDPSEVETLPVQLTETPTEYTLRRQFSKPEDCVRFQIVMMDAAGAVNSWNPRVERIAAP